MQVDEENYEDYEWDEREANPKWYQEETKGSSSKDSSLVFVESPKGPPTINKVEEQAEAKDFVSKTHDDLYFKTLKMVLEQLQKTLEIVL